ncbi:dermonecrotic toxin domain-containing protein [Pseudomonas sp. LB3P38]|uniref:dermonecrotic toxin domain-containing protein n=1 Tax=Pseudomonas lyxosi TaxID=3398358 RepID=UPI0039F0986E
MSAPPLPYFFDEAELASNARQPDERENELSFTIDDLKWLKVVYLATHQIRIANSKPMHVAQLLLSVPDAPDIPLAGAFAMSRPNDGEVTLYTPWKGLIKFADMEDLKSRLKEWLAQPTGKRELLRFLSIEQRSTLPPATAPDIATQTIEGAVFQDQELTLERNQAQNLKTMMGELLKLPTLQSMLDETLKNALNKPFPSLDQRLTRLKSFVMTTSALGRDYQHTLSSHSLSDALLHYYLTNEWPTGDSRVFSNPQHSVSSDADNQAWESAVKELAQSFTPHLQSLLRTFWNTPMSNGQSRSAFFAEGLRDTFHVKLLLQRQQGVLTTQEYLRLMNVSLEPETVDPLRIEKVRITAPFKHYAQLASTLMIGSRETLGFLYTQSRGIEATTDLPAVREIVLEMMKSEGHEDTLLNFMSLDERGTFLSLEPNERVIVGEPIISPVFAQLMDDILGKQRENLSHALSRYRESEGTQDPHALIDKALDVRGLIDDRLLAADAAGRWSTRADQRWSAQPATVRAESAKEQLARLSSVKVALDQLLDNHPVIPTTTRTITEAQRIVDSSLGSLQSSFTHTLSTALRSEFKLHAVTRTLSATEQAIIKTVLDTPVRLQRAALNGFLPDVFSLALKASEATAPLKLASCFVLTERGGLDPKHSGKAILWTPASGFEAFRALTPLLTELDRRLKDAEDRTTLLENLVRSERVAGQTYTLAPLHRIDEHFLDHVQKPYVQLDQACVTRALATRLPATTLASLLKLVALRQPMTGLDRATDIAQSLTTQQKLPAWLAKASIQDQILHAELLQQYLDNVTDDQDYLTGIRSLARTAHHALEKQLKADTFNIDPDKVQIQISARSRSAASTQTLTDFALTHFKDLDKTHFKLVSLDNTKIPEDMDQSYIRDLIRNLKLGEHQQKTLNEAFADTQADATDRRKRFYTQLPWQLMHYAHTEKLQERLSETGFDLIRQVMDMPDAIARAAVDGAHAIIRPLELLGIKSQQAVKVPGVYLIGSSADSTAPQVLVAPHSPRHGVKEYENEKQLLTELKTRGSLLDWVLMNLPQPDRMLLENRMATSSTRVARAAPQTNVSRETNVTLASNPIKGSLLKHLFDDNAALLARLLGCQSDDNKQGEWATIKHVLGEDLHEASTFLTGKLAYPITVWRSYRDIKQSAEDLQTHKWGAAIKEFISGIAQLATLRQSLEAQTKPFSTPSAPAPETPDTRFKWQNVAITAPERTQLKRHESIDVDLNSLTLNSSLGLYTHPTTKKTYAPVEGKVYPVAKRGTRWRIADTNIRGPRLSQNVSKQWVLDRETPAPRFSIGNRLSTAFFVWQGMNVDANGMPEIRRLFPQKARQIDEALDLATTYAWNCFQNLQLLKSSDHTVTPVHQLIMDFIDVPQVQPAHVEQLEKVMSDIFAALLDPSLRKPKTSRFVIGRLLSGAQTSFGFTVPTDAKRKIYLAEKFFDTVFDNYRPHLTDPAFPLNTHARAATLIHELSHIVCNTEDIAYLDSGRPFSHLIDTTSPTGHDLKEALTTLQDTALSIKTPLTQLFMTEDPDTGVWEDPGSTSYENTDRVKAHILTLTGGENLSGARKIFKRDPLVRLKVQLGNADSVAWLISHMGRQLHTSIP